MKKILVGLMAAAVLAGIAQAQETTSKNAVGFINIDVSAEDAAAGKLYALSFPFNNMIVDPELDPDKQHVGEWYFDSTDIALNSAKGSKVYFWDEATQGWEEGERKAKGFVTDKWLKPGDFFFFKPSAKMVITMSGEVPDEETQKGAMLPSGNVNGLGNPYPAPFAFDESPLATDSVKGSKVYFWNEATQGWEEGERKNKGFVTDVEVQPGQGFLFKTPASEASEWELKKPYAWP